MGNMIGKKVYVVACPRASGYITKPTLQWVFENIYCGGKITIRESKIIYEESVTYEDKKVVSYGIDIGRDGGMWVYKRTLPIEELYFTYEDALVYTKELIESAKELIESAVAVGPNITIINHQKERAHPYDASRKANNK